jgi:hypothetical protein
MIGTVTDADEVFRDDGLKPRTTYYYKARSLKDGEYSPLSEPEWIVSESEWYVPVLMAQAIDEHTIELRLTDNSYQDYSYTVYGENLYDGIVMSDSGRSTVFTVTDLQPGTTYTYSVEVVLNEESGTTYENVASATITTPGANPCVGLGSIEREVWRNVPGTDVSAIPVNSPPSEVTVLTTFETPSNNGTDYGARVRGYICPPADGQYIFWIASDDKSELFISTDHDPANKSKIAWVTGHTAIRQWNKYATQQSPAIWLQQGRRYYIEALHKEAAGGDHLAVGWRLPDGTQERPMSASRLMKFEPITPPSCAEDAGQVLSREIWRNIPGTSVSSIPFNTSPDDIVSITGFETSTYYANDYGSRVRAQVCVPQTGSYIFWISSDDNSELWLSTSDDPSGKVKIAFVTGATRVREWTKYSTQQSAPVQLQAGYKYYIEVLHKEANGNDHFAVGWQLPDGVLERPIPVTRLINYHDLNEGARQENVTASTEDIPEVEELMLSPNPVVNREVSLKVMGNMGGSLNEAQVQVIAFTGEVVHTEMVHCDDGCQDVRLALENTVKPGVYLVNVLKGGKRLSRKLVVE